ncbi:MAG: hypothetical protein AAGA62_05305, partial [Bacteroidota bacterium]
IKELRRAARLLRPTDASGTVDSIASLLEELTGSKDTEEIVLPSMQASQQRDSQRAKIKAG